eukprot:TRINITY_DN14796_c0_g1_i1.p1 TRINITY_DN14796_c0_g1~~TRINITY_DN14796_c0_g1_i1.p1  ORF type:complete len:232 (+),score=44.16 TRINITY_DN14796_c0_g1_i1:71-766(+)
MASSRIVMGIAGVGVTGGGLFYAFGPAGGPPPGPAKGMELIGEKGPGHASKYSIILDMDETLLHTSFDNNTGKVHVRPHADEFVKKCAELAETILWTAGTEEYAKIAIKMIGPSSEQFHERIYRNNIWWSEWKMSTKGLNRLPRDRQFTILIDNSKRVVEENDKFNAIVVRDYFGTDKKDKELVRVQKVIEEMVASGKPVPEFLKEKLSKGDLIESEGVLMLPYSSSGWFF